MAKNAASEAPLPDEIRAMSFEQAMAALDEIVQRLESGRVDLEDSVAIYTRGVHLKRHCEAKLKAAGEQVEKIDLGPSGTPVGITPADAG